MATSNAIDADSTGVQSYNGTGTFAGRTITGTTNQIAVTNGSGVSGNPTLALSSIVVVTTQPCVSAYVSSPQANKTGDNTIYTVIFDTVIFDQGSNYNNATGTFTAPVTGRYLVSAAVEFNNVGTVAYTFDIFINSTARTWQGGNTGAVNSASTDKRFSLLTAIIDMSTSDTFTITAQANGQGAKTIGINGDTKPLTFLSCTLLC